MNIINPENLYKHQVKGARSIYEKDTHALWWKPRLGKTYTTIYGVAAVKHPVVIAPKTLCSQWEDDFSKCGRACVPLKTLLKGSKAVNKYFETLEPARKARVAFVINYDSAKSPKMKEFFESLTDTNFALIFDESYNLKNHQAQKTKFWLRNKLIKQAEKIIMLSGSPAPQSETEAIAQLMILNRGRLHYNYKDYTSVDQFINHSGLFKFENKRIGYGKTVKVPVIARSNAFKDLMVKNGDFLNRSDIGEDMNVTERKVFIDENISQKVYNSKMEELENMYSSEQGEVNQAVINNRLISFFDGINDAGDEVSSSKLDYIVNFLADKIALNDEKYVVFFKNTIIGNTLRDRLIAKNINCSFIDGSVKADDRFLNAKKFNEDKDVRVMIAQEITAKQGMNFGAANTIIYLQHTYSGEAYIQSKERTSLIGKTSVEIIHLLARIGKVCMDEKILANVKGNHTSNEDLFKYAKEQLNNK